MIIFHKKILKQIQIGNIKLIIFLLFCSFYFLTSNLHAEVYKWVDENGEVHFSDRKITPSAEEVKIKTTSKNQPAQQQGNSNQTLDQQKYLDFLASERQAKKEQKQENKKQQAKQKRICTNLEDKLKSYEENRVLWYNLDEETGERTYLSEEELQKQITTLRAEIKSNC